MCDVAYNLEEQLQLASELESDLQDTADWCRKWLVDFNARKIELVSLDQSNNSNATDVKRDVSVLEEKSPCKILIWGFISPLNWIGVFTIVIFILLKCLHGALIHSSEFLSIHVALTLYLYKCTTLPAMEYCCHVRAGATRNCY